MIDQQTMIARARKGCCPDCNEAGLIAGPWGGGSRNVFCQHCRVRWNIHGVHHGIVGVDREHACTLEDIIHAQRTYPNDQPFKGIDDGAASHRNHEA